MRALDFGFLLCDFDLFFCFVFGAENQENEPATNPKSCRIDEQLRGALWVFLPVKDSLSFSLLGGEEERRDGEECGLSLWLVLKEYRILGEIGRRKGGKGRKKCEGNSESQEAQSWCSARRSLEAIVGDHLRNGP